MKASLKNPDCAVVEIPPRAVGHLLEKRSILSQAARADKAADDVWLTEPKDGEPATLQFTRLQYEILRQHRPETASCFDLLETLHAIFAK